MKTIDILNKADHLLGGLETPDPQIKSEINQLRWEVQGLILICEQSPDEALQLNTNRVQLAVDELALKAGGADIPSFQENK